jgi:hypothetical protein
MRLWRSLSLVHRRAWLAFVIAALGMQGLVPAGVMVASSAGEDARIILCPQTHPLARAAAARASAEMAALHAAMGHGPVGQGAVDHAAMGHAPAAPDDAGPGSSSAPGGQSCAFAGAGALAGLLPDQPGASLPTPTQAAAAALSMRPLHLAAALHLRPPPRAPPALA